MSKRMKYYVIGLSIAIVIYAPVVSWLTIRDVIVPPELIDTIILFILASATIFYAVRTSDIAEATEEQAKAMKEQADASVQMAREMREQRYDAVRPVIDIIIIEQSITAREGRLQAYGANPKDLPCKLRNVGVGPAIAVHSFIEDIHDPDGNPRRWDFGTLPSAAGKMEYTQEMRLLLMQKDNQRALVAYYEDVYGNRFESIREVNVHEVVRSRGPIKIRKMAEKESQND